MSSSNISTYSVGGIRKSGCNKRQTFLMAMSKPLFLKSCCPLGEHLIINLKLRKFYVFNELKKEF